MLAGLRSLWTRPRWCSLPTATAMPMATQEAPHLQGGAEQPIERLAADVLEHQHRAAASRTISSGRTAHALSNSSFSPCSWARRSRLARDGCAATGKTIGRRSGAVLTQTPPSAEDAFAVLPQNLIAATLIAFASKRERRNVADGARTAIAHSRGRTGCLGRNRHFADARGYSEIGSFGVEGSVPESIADPSDI